MFFIPSLHKFDNQAFVHDFTSGHLWGCWQRPTQSQESQLTNQPISQHREKVEPEQTTARPQDEACHRFALIKNHRVKKKKASQNKSAPLRLSEKNLIIWRRRQRPETKDAVTTWHCCNAPPRYKSHMFGNHATRWVENFCQGKQKVEGKFWGFLLSCKHSCFSLVLVFSLLPKAVKRRFVSD